MTTPILNEELDYLSYLKKQREEEETNQPITLESSKPSEIPSDLNEMIGMMTKKEKRKHKKTLKTIKKDLKKYDKQNKYFEVPKSWKDEIK